MTGTVFDIGYQSYTGTREGRGRGRKAYKERFRIALGRPRGRRVLPGSSLGVEGRPRMALMRERRSDSPAQWQRSG